MVSLLRIARKPIQVHRRGLRRDKRAGEVHEGLEGLGEILRLQNQFFRAFVDHLCCPYARVG